MTLEIANSDLKQLLLSDYRDYFLSMTVDKHIMLLQRIQSIIGSSKDMHNLGEFNFFYNQTLRTLVTLHPMASQKILSRISEKFVQDGKISVKRIKDAIDIGLVEEDHELTNINKMGKQVEEPIKVVLNTKKEPEKIESPPMPSEFAENKKIHTKSTYSPRVDD